MDYNKKLYNDIQKQFDDNRVDEWHSVIPLSEDGAALVDEMSEVSHPGGHQQNGLFLHQEEQGMVKPKDSYTKTVYTMILEDNDHIYNIFAVESDEGRVAQVTRHDKNI